MKAYIKLLNKAVAFTLLVLTTWACGGGGGSISVLPSVENYQQSTNADIKIDILFVVDDSGSMKPEQQALFDNFNDFINFFYDKDFDFRVAVAKTSAFGNNINCKMKVSPFTNRTCTNSTSGTYPYYKKDAQGNFIAGDFIARENGLTPKEFRCGSGNNCGLNSEFQTEADIAGTVGEGGENDPLTTTIGNGTPAPGTDHILSSLSLTKAQMITKFERNILVGLAGTGDERALEAAETTIRNMKQFYPPEQQFPRPNSHLAIIHVGDENDGPIPNNLAEGSVGTSLVGSNSNSAWGSLRSTTINNSSFWPGYSPINLVTPNTNANIATHLNSVMSYLDALKRHESSATVSVHAIQDLPSNDSTRGFNVPYFLNPGTADITSNHSFGLVGYFQSFMAQQTNGLVFSKDSDFGPSLSDLGDAISSLASFIKLAGDVPLDDFAQENLRVFVTPVGESEVEVPRDPVNGYQYEAEGNLVRFYGPSIPPQGAAIRFIYTCTGLNCN